MKNYLGNLIARHMNRAEVLLPRLASRFEPQSSVLQSDGFQVETAEMDVAESTAERDVAETFVSEPVLVAPVSEPVSAVPGLVSVGLVSDPFLDVSVPDVVEPVSPIPSEIERRVEFPFLPSSRSPERFVESSGPAPALSELTTPTIVATEHFESSNSSETISADRVASVSRVASTSRIHSDDNSDSESRSEAGAGFPTPSAGEVTTDTNWTKNTDRVAVLEHVAERATRQSGPTTQPFTPNEPVSANQSIAANESFTINEQVTKVEHETPSLRATPAKSTPPLTRRSVEPQPVVSKPTTETTETTETGRESVAQVTKGEPFATAIKSEPFASGTTSEAFTVTVPPSESDSSVGPSKPQQTNFPTTIVVPEPKESSPVVNVPSESPLSRKQPESVAEESRSTQPARQLETFVARPPVNDPRNLNDPKITRLMPHNDIRSAEAGPATEAGPTINVTIGRIEVRAAASEARPQKQRREQQVLSLDEYLNQRSAGGR